MMLNNLLYDFKLFGSSIETGLFVLVLGMIVCFLGMALIVFVISGIGKIMTAAKNKKGTDGDSNAKKNDKAVNPSFNGVPEETVAAITAAIAAYYSQSGSRCEFIVKKIKKRG